MNQAYRTDRADQASLRFDRGEMRGAAMRTDDGYIRADAVVTRIGVFPYVDENGKIWRELRHPTEVFLKTSLDSMKMVPITNGHPKGKVTSENAKSHQIGTVGESVYADGDLVLASLQINHADGVAAVDAGRKSLSLGYTCDLVHEAGNYDGQAFDARQTNIRYNHLALVDIARAGSTARLNLDEAHASQISADEMRTDSMDPKLRSITLDGIEYQASPEVALKLSRETLRADEAEKKADALTGDLTKARGETDALKADRDTIKADRDTLKGKIDALDSDDAKKTRNDEIQKAVRGRITLERKAGLVLDAKGLEKVDEMTDRQLMEAVIKSKSPEAKLDGESDVYIRARFDGVIETLPKEKVEAALATQRVAAVQKVDGERHDAAEDKRKEALNSIHNRWKPDGSAARKEA